jgi:hypothetical protein
MKSGFILLNIAAWMVCSLPAADGPLIGGSHVYMRGGPALARLITVAPDFHLLSIAILPDGNSEEIIWPRVAQTEGGILFRGPELNWMRKRQLFLMGELLPPGRSSFTVSLPPLAPMRRENRVRLVDLPELKVWDVDGTSDSVPADDKKSRYLALRGKNANGDYYEHAEITFVKGKPRCELVLLSLATEVSITLQVYSGNQATVPQQTVLKEGIKGAEIKRGTIEFGSFKAKRRE